MRADRRGKRSSHGLLGVVLYDSQPQGHMQPLVPERWAEISRLLGALIEMSPAERAAYLEREVRDGGLRRELERYLAFERAEDPVLDAPVAQRRSLFGRALGEPALEGDPLFEPGEVVERYRIEAMIGRGGFGEVYVAEDVEAGKRVALKTLRSVDLHVRARMRSEYRLLARLDHPNVVRYMAQGETASGMPFFVMEYVEGEPITDYCRRRKLPLEARLRLLEHVCAAVEHAHERLIVHRDLKPANILVDPEGRVKVLDFGIGKVLAEVEEDLARAAEASVDFPAPGAAPTATLTGAHWLTPSYAAPEQLRGEPVTQATDVYALGALAFELLTGQRAHDVGGLTLAEAASVVESSPVPLASRVVGVRPMDEHARTLGTTRARLARRLRGDLDAVLAKALQPAPTARYATAGTLLRDLQRWREHRPIGARTRHPLYLAGRFARRRWLPVLVAASVVLTAGGVFRHVSDASVRATREARRASASVDFLTGMFRAANPQDRYSAERLDTLSVRELLDLGAARIGEELGHLPHLQADLYDEVGRIYRDIGLYTIADSLLRLALGLKEQTGADALEVAYTKEGLGLVLLSLDRFEEAEALLREVLAARQRLISPRGSLYTDVGNAHANLGNVLAAQGRLEAAAEHFELASAIYEASPGADPVDLATMQHNLGDLYRQTGEAARAEALLRAAIERRRVLLGERHPELGNSYSSLGVLLLGQRRFDEAIPFLQQTLEIDREALGEDHLYVAYDLDNLGGALCRADRCAEAVPLHEQAYRLKVAAVGPEASTTGRSLIFLGDALRELGRSEEAAPVLERALAIERAAVGAQHPAYAMALIALARVAEDLGETERAEALYREGIEVREAVYGPDHLLVSESVLELGRTLARAGVYAEARPFVGRALAAFDSLDADDQRRTEARQLARQVGLLTSDE